MGRRGRFSALSGFFAFLGFGGVESIFLITRERRISSSSLKGFDVMKSDPLRDPKLKVKWAKRHIHDLDQTVRSFIAKKPWRVSEEADSESPENRIQVVASLRRELPDAISLGAADAVHNLRIALDQLTYRLAELNGVNRRSKLARRFTSWR